MKDEIILATRDGVLFASLQGKEWGEPRRALEGTVITSIIARQGVILAGTREGIQQSDDGGESWRAANQGLTTPHIRWLAYHPKLSDFEVAGTEPAGIFISRDGAESWQERPEVTELQRKHGWRLPYSPGAGAVRGLALHSRQLYAAVEVGGVLRSDDGGESWALVEGSSGEPRHAAPAPGNVHADVHDISVHPRDGDLVFAATGGGLFRSLDGGASWENIYLCYCRSLWLDPEDPEHMLFGPADYVGAQGRIEETRDGGASWRLASGELEAPWPRTMPERFAQVGERLFAILDDGRLLAASLEHLDWHYILESAGRVNALTMMEG